MQNNFNLLEKKISYFFKNKNILELAFIHPSYANEHNIEKYNTNQRLEFLGDSVLEVVSSSFLYSKFPHYDEGRLTKLRAKIVCEENLSDVARFLSLSDYLCLGKGENKDKVKNNNSIMCDTIEALIGAIYLDSNIDEATKFINSFILTENCINKSDDDFKSIVQELANSKSENIIYNTISEEGPDHNKCFTVELLINNKQVSTGFGKSKKDAEQIAAKNYYILINKDKKCI